MVFTRINDIFVLLMVILRLGQAMPVPDSAGMVPMPSGLAYGGIPYGSMSGLLAHYMPQQTYYLQNNIQESALVAADTRTIPVISPAGY